MLLTISIPKLIHTISPIHEHRFFPKPLLNPLPQFLILNIRHILQHDRIQRRTHLLPNQVFNILIDQTLEINHNQKNSHAGCHIDYLGLIQIGLLGKRNIDNRNAE